MALQPLAGVHSLQHLCLAHATVEDPLALCMLFAAASSPVQSESAGAADTAKRNAGHSSMRASCPGFPPSAFLQHAASGPTAAAVDASADVSAASSGELNTSLARSLSASCAVDDSAAAFAQALLEAPEITTPDGPTGLLSLDLSAVDAMDGNVVEAVAHTHSRLVALRMTASHSNLAALPAAIEALPRLQHLSLAYDWQAHACACSGTASGSCSATLAGSADSAASLEDNVVAASSIRTDNSRCKDCASHAAAMCTCEPSEQLAHVWQALVATAALRATNTTACGKRVAAAVQADVAAVSEHAAWWRPQPSCTGVCACAAAAAASRNAPHGCCSASTCMRQTESKSYKGREDLHVPLVHDSRRSSASATATGWATLVPEAPFHLALDLELLVPSMWLAAVLPRGVQSGALTLTYGGRTSAALRAAPITVRSCSQRVLCHALLRHQSTPAYDCTLISTHTPVIEFYMLLHLHVQCPCNAWSRIWAASMRCTRVVILPVTFAGPRPARAPCDCRHGGGAAARAAVATRLRPPGTARCPPNFCTCSPACRHRAVTCLAAHRQLLVKSKHKFVCVRQ